jgi:hypothetical protein
VIVMKWQDREQEPRFGGGGGGHRGGFNAGGYGGGYPRGGYMGGGGGGGGSHGDTAGRQIYVGNVFPTIPLQHPILMYSSRIPQVGKISKIFSVVQVPPPSSSFE